MASQAYLPVAPSALAGDSGMASRPSDPKTAPLIQLELCPWSDFDTTERITQWDGLAHYASEPNPFYESWYLLPSLRALDPQGRVQILHLSIDGQLVGLMPVARTNDYYGHPIPHLANWIHTNCFLGAPLVAKACEKIFWQELLRWADQNCGASLFLHLQKMPAKGVLHGAFSQALGDQGRFGKNVLSENRAMLASDLGSEAYFNASLTTKKRKELRRQRRRLAEQGSVDFHRIEDASAIGAWIDDFLNLEHKGWKGREASSLAGNKTNASLFRSALTQAAERGKLERLSLNLDGRPIAMLVNFTTQPGAYSYKTAFDEDFAQFSPGVLLQFENLKVLDRQDIAWVDSCAAPDHKMIDHIWRERRTVDGYSIAIGGPMRRAFFRLLSWRETGTFTGGIK